MKKISVFDTRICDDNLGNIIIMQAIFKELESLFPFSFFMKLPYLDDIGRESIRHIQDSSFVFFGGTNALSSEMNKYRQWGINKWNSKYIAGVILMGVGWWQYQNSPNKYTCNLLNKVLNRNLLHSVRDNYTVSKLQEVGFDNVINTGCPTLWGLTPEHCIKIPKMKANRVVTTFTSYNQNKEQDKELLSILNRNYEEIYCWIQNPEDFEYAKGLKEDINFIESNVEALDKFFKQTKDVDYIGTRLHAGIKAMQYLKRTIIIGVDNRAIEMKKDFNLPVLSRTELNNLEEVILQQFEIKVILPIDSINKWRNQFKGNEGKKYYKDYNFSDKLAFRIKRFWGMNY